MFRRAGRRLLQSKWLFAFGAWPYDLMTANAQWQASCARLLDEVPASTGLRVLDLGIGPGVSAFSMGRQHPDVDFIGLDLVPRMLERAAANRARRGWGSERLQLLCGNALHVPLASKSVDAVTGHSFLYLLPDGSKGLEEAYRVLRSGGHVAFLEPHGGAPSWSWLIRRGSLRLVTSLSLWRFYSWLHRRFSADQLRDVLMQAGFTEVTAEVTLGGFGIFGRGRKP